MPMYDRECSACGVVELDRLEPIATLDYKCTQCDAGVMKRAWLSTPAVRPDSIPGGILMKNGLCHEDGTPKRYDSWTDVRRAEKEKGLVNRVEHITSKYSGSDKSKHTSRWI